MENSIKEFVHREMSLLTANVMFEKQIVITTFPLLYLESRYYFEIFIKIKQLQKLVSE